MAKEITQPGEYCMAHDIKSPKVFDFGTRHEIPNPGYMLPINSSNVVFDLHDFMLDVEVRAMGGVFSKHEWKKPIQKHITIRNGQIKIRMGNGILLKDGVAVTYLGSLFSDFTGLYFKPLSPENAPLALKLAKNAYQKLVQTLPESSEDYQATEHMLDHIKLSAVELGVGIAGAANTIRNSTIEVTDGHAAIYLFGPNQLIENNIIIFKGKAAVESAAAIKLHQADGTIIRNNDIIIESTGDEAPKAAISLIDSKNVVAENNRIYGIKTLAHAWDDKSSLIDRNNDFRSMLRRPWPSAGPGVR